MFDFQDMDAPYGLIHPPCNPPLSEILTINDSARCALGLASGRVRRISDPVEQFQQSRFVRENRMRAGSM
jgi:hypothetical protein